MQGKVLEWYYYWYTFTQPWIFKYALISKYCNTVNLRKKYM